MATRHRKVRKLRGSRTHGWGQVGQHRKAGHKGGRGKSGLHKHHWTITVLLKDKNVPKGFTPPRKNKVKRWVNIKDLKDLFLKYGREEDGKKVIDLKALGYQKLLGGGKIDDKYKVIVTSISESAKTKLESMGGEVVLVH